MCILGVVQVWDRCQGVCHLSQEQGIGAWGGVAHTIIIGWQHADKLLKVTLIYESSLKLWISGFSSGSPPPQPRQVKIDAKWTGCFGYVLPVFFFFFPTSKLLQQYVFIFYFFISWRLITSQHFSGFCHTLTWISHGVTCIPHPDPPSHLPLHPIPLGLPSAPGPSTCLMHPTWAGDLFHPW